jgi:signal transduction histidine kinase
MMAGEMADVSGEHEAPTPPRQRDGELSQILSAISHEIKNPLASLKLNAQMVARAIERGQTPRIESADLLTRAVNQLDQLASALSDAVRVDSDRLALTLKPLDMVALVRHAAAEAETTYQRPIATELPATPLLAQADVSRIHQVIAYLLANAVKYTPAQRSITLAARRAGGRIRVETRDTGPGIAPRDLSRIFDAFYRGATTSQPHTNEGAGLGLGLYIARRIVERHGGEMGAESAPGQGATIWFTLPHAPRN